jgi:hypothetical protein
MEKGMQALSCDENFSRRGYIFMGRKKRERQTFPEDSTSRPESSA